MHSLISKALTFGQATGITPLNLAILAVILALFWLTPSLFNRALRAVGRIGGFVERHPIWALIIVAAIPLGVRLALLSSQPIPVPKIHDEFSYLLAADTFAHGRVTNPSHPLWQFFETYHVLPFPTYMSKYPPLQGMILAFGQVIFGHPWWGAFLSIGAMIAAVCWMLQGWLPGRWAALGALAVGLQFGIGHAWMNSYWGGAPAAIGACFVLGAFARLKQYRPFPSHPVRYAAIFALGIVILLNSRPWEGIAIAAPTAFAAALWMASAGKKTFFERVRSTVIPATAVLIIGAAGMLYYNWRVTGHALSMPYTTVHKLYSVAPLFVWQTRTPDSVYRHEIMQRFYLKSEPEYQGANTLTTLRGWMALEPGRLRMAKDLLFGNFFLLLCILLIFFRPPKSVKLLLAILAIFMVALALESWNQIHYFGPAIGLVAILKIMSLRKLSTFKFQGRRAGLALASGIVLCAAINLAQDSLEFPLQEGFAQERAKLQKDLETTPGSHVVLVRYSTTHPPSQEWVYNKASIDDEKVVWARNMSDSENRKLFEYFKGRNFWLLEPDVVPVRLQPISGVPTESGLERVSLSKDAMEINNNLGTQWR